MGAVATSSSYDAFLIDMWTSKATMNLVLKDNKVWGLIDKDTSWKGDEYRIPVSYADTGGFSADFNTAQRNKAPTAETTFKLTPATAYSLFGVQRKVIRQSRDKGAVVEVVGRQSAAAANKWKRRQGIYIFGNGGGALATVAVINGTSLTLDSVTSAARFAQNDALEFSSDDGAQSSPAGTRSLTQAARVTKVNVATKVLTGEVAWSTACPGLQVGDYVFIEGTYGNVIKGFDAWLPSSVTSSMFFQVDRSVNPTLLGGQRLNALGLSPRATAKRAALEIWKAGGTADTYILGPERYQDLISDLESAGNMVRTVQVPSGKVGSISFGIQYDAVAFEGPNGTIKAICDYNCSDDVSWMLTQDTWVLPSLGQAPYLDDMGGGQLMRDTNADSIEGRWVGDTQLGCNAPGYNCRVNHTVAA